METNKVSKFEKKVIFHTRHWTLRADVYRDNFLKAAHEHPLSEHIIDKALDEVVQILALTQNIEFNFSGNENPMLLELKTFWTEYNGTDEIKKRVDLALNWRMDTSYIIRQAWFDAVSESITPFRDPVSLPFEALTAEEKEEVKNENSPLASSVKNGARVKDKSTAITS